MRVAELVLGYLRVLVWPALLLALVIVFRARVDHLFDRMTKVDAFGANIEFAQSVGAAKEALAAAYDTEQTRPSGGSEVPVGSATADADPGIAAAARRALARIPDWRWPQGQPPGMPVRLEADTVLRAQECLAAALDSVEQAFGPLTRGSASHMAERTGVSQWTGVIRALDGADRAGALADHLVRESGRNALTPYGRELARDYVKIVSAALNLLVEALRATIARHEVRPLETGER